MNFRTRIKDFLRVNFPNVYCRLMSVKKELVFRKYVRIAQRYDYIANNIRGKEKIKVAFFALFGSVWKYDKLYKLMLSNPKFEPIVIICPIVYYGKDYMISEMNKCCSAFEARGYDFVKSYEESTDTYIDIKKDIDPDVVFYTNPYIELIYPPYYITNFTDRLTGYVAYDYGTSSKYYNYYNLPLHNLVWRYYSSSVEHKRYSELYADNRGINTVNTGFPGTDCFIDKSYRPVDKWKIKDRNVKRIIWAPYHMVEDDGYPQPHVFMRYCDFMLDLVKRYEGRVQFAFKPHPLLRIKLNTIWGKDKTDNYYAQWDANSNSMLSDGDYVSLFLTSDALIHNCGAFTVEYLYTQKPVLMIDSGRPVYEGSNSFTVECLNNHYWAHNEQEICDFVDNVLSGIDELKVQRDKLFIEKLLPPNGKLASQNILDDIISFVS